jgi:pimeloyl-ACP methyl ester carboxylesterase
MANKRTATARSEAFGLFKDKEMDWAFRRTLEFMIEKAAEIGECLYVARRIDETDGESWINEWSRLADRVEALGDESRDSGHLISARECYMRASNYYRTAEYGTSPTHPRFQEIWEKSVDCFHKSAELFSPPIQCIDVHFEDKSLPGYFWRPKEDSRTRPTLIAAGGNDSSLEEVVWWVGMAAVRRGYNFFAFDHPGHRGAVHRYNNCIKRPDYENPYKAAIDLLETQPGVDQRLAMTGYSFGGYVTCRVAAYEKRLQAIAPNSPVIDLLEASMAFGGDFSRLLNLINLIPVSLLKWLSDLQLRNHPVLQAFKQYTDWTSGFYPTELTPAEKLEAYLNFLKPFTVKDHLDHIHCATIALVSVGDGEVLINQAKELVEKIPSPQKRLHLFTMETDGSDDHCQLDNRSRGAQVMFDFFDEVFNYEFESTTTPR